jgi:hypothetical protein
VTQPDGDANARRCRRSGARAGAVGVGGLLASWCFADFVFALFFLPVFLFAGFFFSWCFWHVVHLLSVLSHGYGVTARSKSAMIAVSRCGADSGVCLSRSRPYQRLGARSSSGERSAFHGHAIPASICSAAFSSKSAASPRRRVFRRRRVHELCLIAESFGQRPFAFADANGQEVVLKTSLF